ncbi:MAG: hypothetical protein SH819_10795 [Cytophagales bacterium]|nr:hypothetical protein [Cytophagales bacterium]
MRPLPFLFIVFCMVPVAAAWSQLDNRAFEDRLVVEPADSGKLFAGVNAMGFLKNNEYSKTIIPGYTLFGVQVQPYLSYQISRNVRLDAGAYFQKDFGNEDVSTATPVFSLKWRKNAYAIIFGNIEGSLNHRLIEPLYDFERVLNNRLESGIQFQLNREDFFVDAWLDWQYMQHLKDSRQEQFVAGLSVQKRIARIGSGSLHLPVQVVSRHQGGQLDMAGLPIQTLVNTAVGLEYIKPFEGFIRKMRVNGFYVYDKDITKTRQAYLDGDGWYFNGTVTSRFGLDVMVSYWQAREFMSFQGGRIYPAVSPLNPETIQPAPRLLILRFLYNYNVSEDLSVAIRYEPFLDLAAQSFQYSYGVYVNYRARYFLAKRKH